MKKSLLILLSLSMPLFIMAQETNKQKEVGLVFNSLDNFGLTFKIGSNKSLWRFNALFISGSNMEQTADSSVSKQNNMGFGFKFGREYRKVVAKNLELRFGADLSFTYTQSKSDYIDRSANDRDQTSERIIYRPGINLVLGLNYVFSDNFVIGVELLPYFSYETGTSKDNYNGIENGEIKRDFSGFRYGLSNESVLLSLIYRF